MSGTFTSEQVAGIVRWLASNRVLTHSEGPDTVAAIVKLGLDPAQVWDPDDRGAARAWQQLADADTVFDPQMLSRDLPLVGATVLLQDPENVAEWAAVGRAVDALLQAERRNPRFPDVEDRSVAAWVEKFHNAGRGPFWALQMVQRATDLHVRPDLLGFGSAATPGLLSDAAKAGLDNPLTVRQLAADGLTVPGVLALLDNGRIQPGALIAARRTGVPQHQWNDLLAGMPEQWFPLPTWPHETVDPVGHGVLGAGYSWQQLRTLADAGWTDLTAFKAQDYFGVGPNRRRLTPEQVVALTGVVRNSRQLDKWVEALLQGKARTANGIPPLLNYRDDMVSAITRLTRIGLKPSHIASYRRAGCVTVLDITQAHAAGVTPERADELVSRQPKLHAWDKQRFPSVEDLIHAHLHAA